MHVLYTSLSSLAFSTGWARCERVVRGREHGNYQSEGAAPAVEGGVLEEQRGENRLALHQPPLALAAQPLVVQRNATTVTAATAAVVAASASAAADVAAGPSRYCPPEPASTSSTAARRKMEVWCSAGISMNLPAAISSGESREFCHVTYSPMPGRACSESSM